MTVPQSGFDCTLSGGDGSADHGFDLDPGEYAIQVEVIHTNNAREAR